MELNRTSTKPPIIEQNLGENYLRILKHRFIWRTVIVALSMGLIMAISLWRWLGWWSLVWGAAMIISTVVTSLIVYNLFWQHLFLLVDSLYPVSQAIKANQLAPFMEIENSILRKIFMQRTSSEVPTAKTTSTGILSAEALDQVQFGIISFDTKSKINYANKFAREFITIEQKLRLDFDQEQISLTSWIDQAKAAKLTDEHTWHNLPLKVENNQPKRWFNLIASFHKLAPNEVILMFSETSEPQQKQNAFDFVSYAAHELRGPTTVIRGYLDILQNDFPEKTDAVQTVLDRLVVAGNRLSSYINNILNVAKFDQKSFTLALKPTAPHEIIDDIYDDITLRATTNQRQLSIQLEPTLPTIYADKTSLTQAITNLIDNAVKYSKPNGEIQIRVFKQGGDVNFQVIDQGIGMPSSVLNNLFHRFYRSHRSKQQVGGTGIGLFITKIIVDAHHGQITVSSELDKGTTFTISLPVDPTQTVRSDNFIHNHGMIRK